MWTKNNTYWTKNRPGTRFTIYRAHIGLKIEPASSKNTTGRYGSNHLKIAYIGLKIGVPRMRLLQFV